MPSNQTSNTRTYMSPRPEPKPDKPHKNKQLSLHTILSKKNTPWIIIFVLLLAIIFFCIQYRQAQNMLAGNSGKNDKYQRNLQKLIILPTNEKPTIATVKDTGKLRNQAFFRDAKNGDVLFVYNTSRKAILYRPNDNIIVNVQPVSTPSNSSIPNQ